MIDVEESRRFFIRLCFKMLCLCLLLCVSRYRASAAQKLQYNQQAEMDQQGNVYVSSDAGKLIKVADAGHCEEIRVGPDNQTAFCLVMRSLKPEEFTKPLQLEIYFKGGSKKTIEPGAPIREWHLWNNGQQVAVHFGISDRQSRHVLYDLPSANAIEELQEPPEEKMLPQWAKSQSQIDDESVPMSAALSEERSKWIGKVLREISKISPGMRREDLLKVFTTEGGLSTRTQQTYVYADCPYIKVTVRFKVAGDKPKDFEEDPNDIIESISPPYLAWSVKD